MRNIISKKFKSNKFSIRFILIVVFILFFSVSIPISFAMNITSTNLFNSSKKEFNKLFTNNLSEHTDASINDEVKVCKDVTCTNPKPGIIYFKSSINSPSGLSPLVVSSVNGVSGEVWGNQLGTINFQPPYGGVYFANPETGLLKGTAWSETSGVINFSVTGQKVIIDPKTGKWSGWAWASGPYGGWIQFDCNTGSCVQTTWNNQNKKVEKKHKTKDSVVKKSHEDDYFSLAFKNVLPSVIQSWEKLGQIIINESRTVNSGFDILISKLTNYSNQTGEFVNDTYNSVYNSANNMYNSTVKSISGIKTVNFNKIFSK